MKLLKWIMLAGLGMMAFRVAYAIGAPDAGSKIVVGVVSFLPIVVIAGIAYVILAGIKKATRK